MIRSFFDNRLVGRNKEIELIKNEYNKLLKGEMAVITVIGVAGVGKTHLYKCAFNQIKGKTLVNAKFIQDTERSLSAIAELIGQITDHLLMLPRDTIDTIVLKANEKISNDIALLASICPKIRSLLRVSKSANSNDYERLKYRVKNTILNYMEIASKHLSPLIIYFDDLQWADRFSLEIIRTLLSKKTLRIMFAFSYRETINDNMKRLIEVLETKSAFINLEPLVRQEVEEYLCILFKEKIENVDELTSIVYGLTLGNPFYIKETIMKLSDDKILAYSEERQSWELELCGVNRFIINNDVERIIKNKIFQNEDHDLLELISCLNGRAEYDTLKLLYDKNEINVHLQRNIDSAIIMKCKESDGRISILFNHDIIYKLVDSRMTAKQKHRIHYRIAEKLLRDSTVKIENKNVFIASHLIKASKEMAYGEADKWTRILFDAGVQEKQRASIDVTLKIFEFCVDMLPYSAEKDERFLTDVQLELAECLYMVKRYDESHEIIEELIQSNQDKSLMLAIKTRQLYLNHYQRDHEKTIKTGRQILKSLGFGFGKYRLPFDLIKSRIIYNKKRIESLAKTADHQNEKAGIILDTLRIMNSSAAVSDDTLTAAVGLSAALVSAKYGYSANALIGYVSYAYVLCAVWKDYKKTIMLVKQICQISEKTTDHSCKSVVYFLIGAFLSHWSVSIREADQYLQKGIEYGALTGDFLFLGYSISTSLDMKAFMGEKLDDLLSFIQDCRQKYAEIEQYQTAFNLEAYTEHILSLKHGCDDLDFERVAKKYPKLTPFEKLTEKTLLLERLLLLDELDFGYKLVKIVAPQMKSNKGLIGRLSTVFYSLLIRIGVHSRLDNAERAANKRHIHHLLKELKYYAGLQSKNFSAHYILAKAEYETRIKHSPSDLYEQSAQLAQKNGNISLEALAYWLAAKRNRTNEKISKFYAAESAKLQKTRGADDIALFIETEYNLVQGNERTDSELENMNDIINAESLLHTFIRHSEGLGEDDKTMLFLKTIDEAGFADRCCIIFEKSRWLYLKYQMDKEDKAKNYAEPVNINNLARLPHKVIRYAARMQKEVNTANKQWHALFENDPYVTENPSTHIVCIPMINCDVLVGVVYLESHETPIDEAVVFEIKALLPSLVTTFSKIKNINIKDLFVPVDRPQILSSREIDIVKLLAQGLSNDQMGEALGLSVGTVKKHMSSIMTKLDAENRITALIKAKDMNII